MSPKLKTKMERDAQIERIAWRISARKGLTIREAVGFLMERLVVSDFAKRAKDFLSDAEPSIQDHPYAYEGRICICSLCGDRTRLDGTDSFSMVTATLQIPWEMLRDRQQWSRGHEICRACIFELPEKWRRLFEPPTFPPLEDHQSDER